MFKDIVAGSCVPKSSTLGKRSTTISGGKVSQGLSTESDSDSDGSAPPREYVGLPILLYWSRDLNLSSNNYNSTFLDQKSAEFAKVKGRFHESIQESTYSIYEIIRIENLKTWVHYQIQKLSMTERKGNDLVNEKYLFHGTRDRENVDSIMRNGFSKAMISIHMYGNGL